MPEKPAASVRRARVATWSQVVARVMTSNSMGLFLCRDAGECGTLAIVLSDALRLSSTLAVGGEDVVLRLHDRMAGMPAIAAASLGRERAGGSVVVELGVPPAGAAREPLAVLGDEQHVLQRVRYFHVERRFLVLLLRPFDLDDRGAFRERLAVEGNAGLVGRDYGGIGHHHLHQLVGLADGDHRPILVSLELGHGEAAGDLHGVLVRRGAAEREEGGKSLHGVLLHQTRVRTTSTLRVAWSLTPEFTECALRNQDLPLTWRCSRRLLGCAASRGDAQAMVKTVLYAEKLYDNDKVEREAFGSDVRVVWRNVANLSQLEERDCAEIDGLMVMRHAVTAEYLAKFPKLACVVRMVGYDKIDRQAAAARKVMVCNVPDYGTTEVADHALALALSLRRGIALHLEAQRRPQPAPWSYVRDPLLRRNGVQTFGIVGLGRIGTAAALRAKAFQFRVVAYDPYMPNGTELGVGVERVRSLEALMEQTDTLSIHAPLTPETRGMISRPMLERMPKGGVVVNTARGPIVDVDALADLLKRGHLAGVGLDVLPVEPPVEPIPELLRAYRARESWCEGRLIITPHSAFFTPEAWDDTRLKAAETMRAALVGPRPQNVITPEMF